MCIRDSPKGEGWKYVLDGRIAYDGDKPMNTNGGRTSYGHAFGASGMADVFEAVTQMRGEAGEPVSYTHLMAETARAIHNAGAYANIQLSHGGKYGGLVSVGGDQDGCEVAYGPSHEMTPAGEVQEMCIRDRMDMVLFSR